MYHEIPHWSLSGKIPWLQRRGSPKEWRFAPQDEQNLEGAKEGDDEGRPHVQLPPAGMEEPLLVNQQPQAGHQRADHREDAELPSRGVIPWDTQRNT